MTHQQPPSQPEIPAELWMLRNTSGTWVQSIDEARGGPTYLVALSEAKAKAAAEHQNDFWDCDCIPVRVK